MISMKGLFLQIQSDELFHWVVHLIQIAIVLFALYRLAQNYRSVRSKFNLGLVVFGVAMLIQIILFLVYFTFTQETIFHFGGEIAEILALLIFLYLITK